MEFLKSYTDLGWRLFPVHSIVDGRCTCGKAECGSPGKHPRFNGWQDKASNDISVVENWARTWPACNWGLACGPESGVLVIDIDVKGANGFEAMEEFEEAIEPLPKTLQATTGSGGRHLFFSYKGSDIGNKVGWLKGVDIRSKGGYVILAPGTHISGGSYRWDNFKTAVPLPLPDFVRKSLLATKDTKNVSGDWNGTGKRMTIDDMLKHGIPEGFRDRWLFEEACSLRTDNLRKPDEGRAVVEALILQAAAMSNFPREEALKCVEQAYKQDRAEHHAVIAKTLVGIGAAQGFHDLTDLGNRDRFLDLYGDDLRYVEEWDQWYTWSDRGWTAVSELWVKAKAEDVVAELKREIVEVPDDKDAKAYAEWITKSSSRAGINSIVALTTTSDRIRRRADQFDTVQTDLACANGIVDLVTGNIRPFSRSDLVLKNTGVVYNPGADNAIWANFLDTTTNGDESFKDFLQRVAGYTLTGATWKEKFFTITGPPASGKSTFMDAMIRAMGSYATTLPAEVVTTGKYQSGSSDYHIAKLPGIRLASISEIRADARYDDALVKSLTGGDEVSARQIYGKPFEFGPQFKLWIATNHDPRTTDKGMERRITQVPFSHSVEESKRNPNLKNALRNTEREAVLAWMVEGAMKFLADNSFGQAKVVDDANLLYRQNQDLFQVFLDSEVVYTPNGEVTVLEMYRAWKAWGENFRAEVGMVTSFVEKLTDHGIMVDKPTGSRTPVVKGVALKVPAMPTMPWA